MFLKNCLGNLVVYSLTNYKPKRLLLSYLRAKFYLTDKWEQRGKKGAGISSLTDIITQAWSGKRSPHTSPTSFQPTIVNFVPELSSRYTVAPYNLCFLLFYQPAPISSEQVLENKTYLHGINRVRRVILIFN